MSDEIQAKALTPIHEPSLLELVSPTDPAAIRELENARLGNIHYAAIGRVAAAWARFEFAIDGWLAIFADVPDAVGVCFTGQMIGSRPRVDCFIALARHRGANRKWPGLLDDFARNVQAVAEQRNRAVHDVWELTDAGAPHRIETTARRVVRTIKIHVPTQDLLDLEERIQNLESTFVVHASEIWAELHSSPETSFSSMLL